MQRSLLSSEYSINSSQDASTAISNSEIKEAHYGYSNCGKMLPSIKFFILSTVELVLMTWSITKIDTLYDDFQSDINPYKTFLTIILPPMLLAKCINLINLHSITTQATKVAVELSERISDTHFSLQYKDRTKRPDQLAGKLIFDCFDTIRPGVVTIHDKIIYKVLEIFIYAIGFYLDNECNWQDTLPIGLFSILFVLISAMINDHRLKKSRVEYLSKYESFYGYISSTVVNYEAVIAFQAKRKLIKNIREKLLEFSRKLDVDNKVFDKVVGIFDLTLFPIVTMYAVALSYYSGYKGDQFFYLYFYCIQQARNIKEFYEAMNKLRQAKLSHDEVGEYLRVQPLTQKEDKSGDSKSYIRFENVNLDVRIAKLSFSINAGRKVIVRGPSGCGKSCILRLIANLYQPDESKEPSSGVYVVGFQKNKERIVTYIHADTQILPYSLADNILIAENETPYQDETQAKRLEKASKDAVLEDKINNAEFKNPSKVATMSTGQKKRIGLARLFINPTPIILLDEPIANLDSDTQKTLMNNLQNLIKDESRTVFIVEHSGSFYEHPIYELFKIRIEFEEDFKIYLYEKIGTNWRKYKEPIGNWGKGTDPKYKKDSGSAASDEITSSPKSGTDSQTVITSSSPIILSNPPIATASSSSSASNDFEMVHVDTLGSSFRIGAASPDAGTIAAEITDMVSNMPVKVSSPGPVSDAFDWVYSDTSPHTLLTTSTRMVSSSSSSAASPDTGTIPIEISEIATSSSSAGVYPRSDLIPGGSGSPSPKLSFPPISGTKVSVLPSPPVQESPSTQLYSPSESKQVEVTFCLCIKRSPLETGEIVVKISTSDGSLQTMNWLNNQEDYGRYPYHYDFYYLTKKVLPHDQIQYLDREFASPVIQLNLKHIQKQYVVLSYWHNNNESLEVKCQISQNKGPDKPRVIDLIREGRFQQNRTFFSITKCQTFEIFRFFSKRQNDSSHTFTGQSLSVLELRKNSMK